MCSMVFLLEGRKHQDSIYWLGLKQKPTLRLVESWKVVMGSPLKTKTTWCCHDQTLTWLYWPRVSKHSTNCLWVQSSSEWARFHLQILVFDGESCGILLVWRWVFDEFYPKKLRTPINTIQRRLVSGKIHRWPWPWKRKDESQVWDDPQSYSWHSFSLCPRP